MIYGLVRIGLLSGNETQIVVAEKNDTGNLALKNKTSILQLITFFRLKMLDSRLGYIL